MEVRVPTLGLFVFCDSDDDRVGLPRPVPITLKLETGSHEMTIFRSFALFFQKNFEKKFSINIWRFQKKCVSLQS